MGVEWHVEDNTGIFKDAFDRGVKAALHAVGQQARRNVAKVTPVGESYAATDYSDGHIGGTLRQSITSDVRGNSVFVGSDLEYAPYVETGHKQKPGRFVPRLGKRLKAKYVAPRPYLRPGIMDNLGEYKELIERYIKENLP